jgi:hypothetical protein
MKVAAGPKELTIKVEKLNWGIIYNLVTTQKISLSQTKWTQTDKEITDNSQNTYDKYAPFSYTPEVKLESGKYKITISSTDKANNTSNYAYYLTIGGFESIATPQEQQAIEELPKTQEEKQIIKDEFTKELTPVPTPDDTSESGAPTNIFTRIVNLFNWLINWIRGLVGK